MSTCHLWIVSIRDFLVWGTALTPPDFWIDLIEQDVKSQPFHILASVSTLFQKGRNWTKNFDPNNYFFPSDFIRKKHKIGTHITAWKWPEKEGYRTSCRGTILRNLSCHLHRYPSSFQKCVCLPLPWRINLFMIVQLCCLILFESQSKSAQPMEISPLTTRHTYIQITVKAKGKLKYKRANYSMVIYKPKIRITAAFSSVTI